MFQNHFRRSLAFSLAVGLLVTGCRDTLPTQDLAKVFPDRRIPRQLTAIQQQIREIPLKDRERIIERVERDKLRKDLIRVGIIDSGVDLAHPDLIDRIDYRVENGRIVGAGHDLLGRSGFGSQMLVNPTLFAFGAKGVKNGQIRGAVESPLALLEEINDSVVTEVLDAVAADPLLGAQRFGKLHRESFTVFGLYELNARFEQNMREHETNAKEGKLLDASAPQDAKGPEPRLSTEMSREENLPPILRDEVAKRKHADRFLKIVSDAMARAEKRYALTRNIEQVHRFVGADPASGLKAGLDILKATMVFVLRGPKSFDPLETLKADLQSHERFSETPLKDILRALARDLRAAISEMAGNPKLGKETLRALEERKAEPARLEQIADMIDRIETDPAERRAYESRLRRHAYRAAHPYIARLTARNSHGTHVAGTVAMQHGNIRIVPIRATTQSVRVIESERREVIDRFVDGFKAWLASDIGKAIRDDVVSEYRPRPLADSTIVKSVAKYLEKNTLNAVFMRDVIESIKVVGRERIKIANVSLGTMLKKKVALTDRIPSIAEDLFAEFARHRIGETIETEAGKSLFLISTGNDGDWVDGISKTGFPVGVTSLRAIRATERLGIAAPPNNRLKNVIAVGSIARSGTLSVFTNILIDPNTPQIFSVGEEIMAPIPKRTEKTSAKAAASKLQSLTELLKLAKAAYQRHAALRSPGDPAAKSAARSLVPFSLEKIAENVGQILHITEDVTRERMSGTSMASPTSTGVLAEFIIEKMAAESVASGDVYDHPAFAPETLIRDLKGISQDIGKGQSLQLDALLRSIREWKESRGAKAMNAKVKSLFPAVSPGRGARCESLFAGRAAVTESGSRP